ncbi:hypothetical protein KKA15_04555 [Patescibacteria group bacterium]|nr:hypothetical protein [Patescibacteria group bacterium]
MKVYESVHIHFCPGCDKEIWFDTSIKCEENLKKEIKLICPHCQYQILRCSRAALPFALAESKICFMDIKMECPWCDALHQMSILADWQVHPYVCQNCRQTTLIIFEDAILIDSQVASESSIETISQYLREVEQLHPDIAYCASISISQGNILRNSTIQPQLVAT